MEIYRESNDPEALHSIRVDIKKIKAILQVINNCVKGFKAHKTFIPFWKVFKRAGKIRDQSIQTKLLSKYQVSRLKHIDEIKPEFISAFKKDIPQLQNQIKIKSKELAPFINNVHKNDLQIYLRVKIKKVKSKLYPETKVDQIHKTRKLIKQMVYLSEAIGKIDLRQARFYDEIQEVIGLLHDKQILIELLNKEEDASTDDIQKIQLECLKDQNKIKKLSLQFYQEGLGLDDRN